MEVYTLNIRYFSKPWKGDTNQTVSCGHSGILPFAVVNWSELLNPTQFTFLFPKRKPSLYLYKCFGHSLILSRHKVICPGKLLCFQHRNEDRMYWCFDHCSGMAKCTYTPCCNCAVQRWALSEHCQLQQSLLWVKCSSRWNLLLLCRVRLQLQGADSSGVAEVGGVRHWRAPGEGTAEQLSEMGKRDPNCPRKWETPHCFHQVSGINPGVLAKFQVR